MRLTRHVDLALRVLMYLGLHDGRVCTIGEIAAAYGVSESHLTKVAHRLGVRGLVQTVRGHGGGLRLAVAPGQIELGRVVRLLEDDLRLVECFDRDSNTCPIAGPCALTGILDTALRAFLDVLDRHSLADLLGSRAALLRRLGASGRTLPDEHEPPPGAGRARPSRNRTGADSAGTRPTAPPRARRSRQV